jgi:uncharacterized cupin superfamily protein
MVPEAQLRDDGAGLVPASTGWFVLNARDSRWFQRPGRGDSLPLTGCDEFEAETYFPMLGMSIQVLPPSEPNGTYHWETEQEDFLVLAGEALLVVEGHERPLKQWDFVHCPPETGHVFVGVGDEPCVILAASSRQSRRTARGASTVPTRSRVATTRARRRTPRTARSRTDDSRHRSRCAIATACCRTSRRLSSSPHSTTLQRDDSVRR